MKLGVWTGTEVDDKPIEWLIQTGKYIQAYGADVWFLRVGYGGILKISPTWCSAIEKAVPGLSVYPWFYSYGNTYQPHEKELVGMFVAANWHVTLDVEDEYFTQNCTVYKSVNLYGVTGYANVLDKPAPYVDNMFNNFTCEVFLPQVYYQYDAKVWRSQYKDFTCIPIVTGETLEVASQLDAVSYWEYQNCTQETMKYLVGALKQEDTSKMEKQFSDSWLSSGIPMNTGIYKAALAHYIKGVMIGYPLSKEIHTTDWSGNVCIIQYFSHCWISWYPDGTNYGYTSESGALKRLW